MLAPGVLPPFTLPVQNPSSNFLSSNGRRDDAHRRPPRDEVWIPSGYNEPSLPRRGWQFNRNKGYALVLGGKLND